MPSVIRNRVARRLVLAAVLVMAARTARAQEIPPPADVKTAARTGVTTRVVGGLRPGDVLRVVVFREKELSGDFLIDARGIVQIPGVGALEVVGMEPQEAQQRIVDALKLRGFSSPEVAVQAQIRVSVLGEVRQPALYPTEPGTSLLQLVTLAGGPTERANLRKTRVVRDGRVFVVDLESGLAGSAAGRVVLYSGDYVIVPRKTGFTRETFAFVVSLVSGVAALTAAIISLQRT